MLAKATSSSRSLDCPSDVIDGALLLRLLDPPPEAADRGERVGADLEDRRAGAVLSGRAHAAVRHAHGVGGLGEGEEVAVVAGGGGPGGDGRCGGAGHGPFLSMWR